MSACKVVDGEHDIKGDKKASVHKLRDAFEELNQLQNEHKIRIKVCEEDIEKFKKFKDDYLHLQKRLTSLPDKTSHEIMVPIGSLAFMPGRLIHTNEITVLLGDNWFVERSAKQATGIVLRRIRDVNENLQKTENVRTLHKNWLKEAEDLSHGNAGEQVEIIEGPFDEQEVQISREETKKKLKDYNKKQKEVDMRKNKKKGTNKENNKSKNLNTKETGFEKSTNMNVNNSEDRAHEDLMNRLDQLYLEEQCNRELESEDVDEIAISNDQAGGLKNVDDEESESDDLTEESEDLTEESTDEDLDDFENNEKKYSERPRLKRRVSWADDKPPYETIIPDNDNEDIFRINYTPSKLYKDNIVSTEDSNTGCVNVNNPSELYKAYSTISPIPISPLKEAIVESHDVASSPRGILKKSPNSSLQTKNVLRDEVSLRHATKYEEIVTEESEDIIARPPTPPRHNNQDQDQSQMLLESSEGDHLSQPVEAIKHSVVARDDQSINQTGPVKNTTKSNDSSNSEPKKVSRFKASRMNKK